MMPNRLRGAACYLAGPMSDSSDLGAGWRQDICQDLIDMGVVIYDPTDKWIDVGTETAEEYARVNEMRAAGDLEGVRDFMKVVRRVDLRMVDLSSFVIARLDGTPTVGTWEEIATGVNEQKPVLIWLDGQYDKSNVSSWLLSQIPLEHIFESRQELFDYLHSIDESETHPTDRRWMLFHYESLYRHVVRQ